MLPVRCQSLSAAVVLIAVSADRVAARGGSAPFSTNPEAAAVSVVPFAKQITWPMESTANATCPTPLMLVAPAKDFCIDSNVVEVPFSPVTASRSVPVPSLESVTTQVQVGIAVLVRSSWLVPTWPSNATRMSAGLTNLQGSTVGGAGDGVPLATSVGAAATGDAGTGVADEPLHATQQVPSNSPEPSNSTVDRVIASLLSR